MWPHRTQQTRKLWHLTTKFMNECFSQRLSLSLASLWVKKLDGGNGSPILLQTPNSVRSSNRQQHEVLEDGFAALKKAAGDKILYKA
jgi:hypothetical protein